MILRESALRRIIQEFMGIGAIGKKNTGSSARRGGSAGDWMGDDRYEDTTYTPDVVDVEDQPGLDTDDGDWDDGDGDDD